MTLTLVRSLPRAWDGAPVEWSDLALTRGSLDLHVPPKCERCGSASRPWRAGGTLHLGRDEHTGQPRRTLALFVSRCRDCQHDVVYDERTGELWDLDGDDYGPQGSTVTNGSLW